MDRRHPQKSVRGRIQLTTRQGNLNTNSSPNSDRLQPYSPLYEWNQPTKRKDCHCSPHCYFLPKLCNLFTTIQTDISAKMNILTHVTPAGRDRTQNNSHEHTDSCDPGWPWQDSKQLTWTHWLMWPRPAVTGLKTTHMNTLTHVTPASRDRTQNHSHEHTNFTWNLAAITHRFANAEQKSQVSETHQPDCEMRVCGDCGVCNTNSTVWYWWCVVVAWVWWWCVGVMVECAVVVVVVVVVPNIPIITLT